MQIDFEKRRERQIAIERKAGKGDNEKYHPRVQNKMAKNDGVEFSAEVHFAQRLASNEKKIRDKAMRKLKKWLDAKSAGGITRRGYANQ